MSTMKTDDGVPRSKIARSPEELFPLMEYCRAGKLKEVREWIAAGNPIDPPQSAKRRTRRSSPLEIAIEKGFFALAELLLEGGSDPAANPDILSFAVHHRDVEIAKLLLDRGASANSVWVTEIFDGGPEMLKLFIEHGFDPTADLAYCNALCRHVHPLLFVLKEFKERFPDLQQQAEMALCHHCKEGNLRAVSLLLWAGARANALVPDPVHGDDPDLVTTPIEEAVCAGRLDILKRLKPQDFPELLKTLADAAWWKPTQPLIDYLINLGVPLNTKPSGGSKVLDHVIWRLGFGARPGIGISSSGEMDENLNLIEYLVSRGAKWIPNPDEPVRDQRAHLRDIDPNRLLRLFRILKEGEAATVEFLESLLASSSFRKRVGDRVEAIEKVLHPPLPKAASLVAAVTPGKAEPKPRPPITELSPRAEALLLNIVRQYPMPHFTQLRISDSIYAHTARRCLGLPRGDNEDLTPIFTKAAKDLNKRLKSFSIEVGTDEWRRGSESFSVQLTCGMEWPDALKEAWLGAESPNEYLLTDVGVRLLALTRTGDLEPGFADEQKLLASIGAQARDQCYARGSSFENYLHEVVAKAGISLRWEVKGKRYGPWFYRTWIEVDHDRQKQKWQGLNPRLEMNLAHFKKADLDASCALIHQLVVKVAPTGTDPLHILRITSRRELDECFPKPEEVSGGVLAEFLGAVPLNETVRRSYDFRDNAPCWFFAVIPETDWPTTLASIQDEGSQPTLEQRFGISSDAAKIIAWIESLRPEELLSCYTPIVEDECERRIGLEPPWSHENLPAYLQMLVDEINEKTHYDLRLQSWNNYSQVKWRIRVARKKTDIEDVLRQLHWIAWKRGVVLDVPAAQETLERLLSGASRSSHEK